VELGTFGAILTFALEFEGAATDFFAAAAGTAKADDVKEVFDDLTKAGQKRLKTLERTRRENVAEMILEPIADFCSEDYPCDASVTAGAGDGDLVKQAVQLEGTAVAYYREASDKVSVAEVARILSKMAKQHLEQKEMLEELKT
jgi:rubrerythrin